MVASPIRPTGGRAGDPDSPGPDRPVRLRPYDQETVVRRAAEVFLARGYDATSMGQLSLALGLSKSSLYHHVRSKEELLARAVGRALDALEAIPKELEGATNDPGARLGLVLRRTVATLLAETPFVTLLVRLRGNSPIELEALERRRRFDEWVAGIVAEAAEAGAARADLDPRLVTRLLFGMVNSITEWYRPPEAPAGPVGATDDALPPSDRRRPVQATGRGFEEVLAETVATLALDGLRPPPAHVHHSGTTPRRQSQPTAGQPGRRAGAARTA